MVLLMLSIHEEDVLLMEFLPVISTAALFAAITSGRVSEVDNAMHMLMKKQKPIHPNIMISEINIKLTHE